MNPHPHRKRGQSWVCVRIPHAALLKLYSTLCHQKIHSVHLAWKAPSLDMCGGFHLSIMLPCQRKTLAETTDSQCRDRQAYLPAVRMEPSLYPHVNMTCPFPETTSPVPYKTDRARRELSAERQLVREHDGKQGGGICKGGS